MARAPRSRKSQGSARRPGLVVNIALQGGGSHGAFAWGVLDRLLEEEDLVVPGVVGTSAGAMNAVLLAAGLAQGGRDGARALLRQFWTRISQSPFASMPAAAFPAAGFSELPNLQMAGWIALEAWSRLFSPYQFNPFNLNPLCDLLRELIDFAVLRAKGPQLFLSATNV